MVPSGSTRAVVSRSGAATIRMVTTSIGTSIRPPAKAGPPQNAVRNRKASSSAAGPAIPGFLAVIAQPRLPTIARSEDSLGAVPLQHPVASALPLDRGRFQSERLRRGASDPKIELLGVDREKHGARLVRLGRKERIVGGLPSPANLGFALFETRSARHGDEGILGLALKDEHDLAGAANVRRFP